MANEQMAAGAVDIDQAETHEWYDAIDAVLERDGPERVQHLINSLMAHTYAKGVTAPLRITTPYCNTIAPKFEPEYPGDMDLEKRISAIIRWNAVAMVLHAAKKKGSELGGHLASFASAATLYEVGFHHFFKADSDESPGDMVMFQGHSSPGIYARAFLEGRFEESDLEHFRQEVHQPGLSSYPHPYLMPKFWQFPTVSMGLGMLQAIYQARFLKYLQNRKLAQTEGRHVWIFCGDGEMDEPESLGCISLAAREKLDNLIVVINCNLQRLDGPVRGNSKVIQELEGIFRGAGWHVVKNIWGRGWDALFEKDTEGHLLARMEECVDGDYQNYKARDGAYVREHFFGANEALQDLVKNMSDDEIWRLQRGGHDPVKVHAAYADAVATKGKPTVILAKTVKGYGMGAAGEGLNITHQQKKMSADDLKHFVERFSIPIPEADIADAPFYRPSEDSPEIQYIKSRREALGGYVPTRREKSQSLNIPPLSAFDANLKNTGDREVSSTMAFVRILNTLLKDKEIGKHVVPIVPDECRTFGMEGMFRQYGIYSPVGQLYEPVDKDQLMYYKESKKGQVLEEGINEAGAFASWMSAATSYSTNNVPMIPFYIYYSMFGYQRVGDLAWAAGDMGARGFVVGGTAGRTTLAGEGLQHQDGHNLMMFGMVPNCVSYDPTFSYEMAVIIHDGLQRMMVKQHNVYYYITAMNENYYHPDMPEGCEDGIIKGMYRFQKGTKGKFKVQLMGSGTILREVIKAAEILGERYDVSADIWSVTSFNELRKEARHVTRQNQLSKASKARMPYITECLQDAQGPVIAATDYIRAYADQVREYVPQKYVVLGTDGYGRSDTRAALRYFFEVDANYIAFTAIRTLADMGMIGMDVAEKAMNDLNIDPHKPNPETV